MFPFSCFPRFSLVLVHGSRSGGKVGIGNACEKFEDTEGGIVG